MIFRVGDRVRVARTIHGRYGWVIAHAGEELEVRGVDVEAGRIRCSIPGGIWSFDFLPSELTSEHIPAPSVGGS